MAWGLSSEVTLHIIYLVLYLDGPEYEVTYFPPIPTHEVT